MHLSRYLLTFPLPENPGQLLIYSTRKTSLVQLPITLFRDLENGVIPEGSAEQLIRLGVLVADPEEERREVWGMQAAINRMNPNVQASVILGMACNFRCLYCYEGSLKDGAAMSQKTADAVVDFLLARFRPGKEKLILDFYGGEPLLYVPMIRYLAGRLKPQIEARGGAFRMSLVTNGSLLTPETVDGLLPLGLTSAKVTVDGPPEVHNANRPFANHNPSFDAILTNLASVADRLRLTLSGVYTLDTWPRFPELLDLLPRRGLPPEKLAQVKFDPVMRVDDAFAAPHLGSCNSTGEPWVVEASLALRREILRRVYPQSKLRPSACMVDVEDGFTIHCDGGLYKCVILVGRKEFQAGNVWRGLEGLDRVYGLEHWRYDEKCRDCVYLPICFGGCRFAILQETGAMRGVDCQKAYYDAALAPMLRQDIQLRH